MGPGVFMIDSRFPHMKPVSLLPDDVSRPVRDVLHRIYGLRAAWDVRSDNIFFYYGDDMHNSVIQWPAGRWESWVVDRICLRINKTKKPARLKELEVEYARREEESDARSAHEASMADKRNEAESLLEHRENRRGMGNHFRGSAVVSGLKGN